ncbi:MAG: response regulator transcription factor [Chloroflexi bacterium]|nr:response regulator transcription factor [Chloroflexota bacterium]
MSIRILLVDDHAVVRRGLRALLDAESEFQVVGEAADGDHILQLTQSLQPDVILMDVNMRRLNGIEATRQVVAKFPKTRVLILTLHEDVGFLREAMEAGAAGYILKSAIELEIIKAIHTVVSGDPYVDSAMAAVILKSLTAPKDAEDRSLDDLSKREIDILRLIAHGHTNREIAAELHISVRTVEGHRASILSKLNLSTPIQIVRYAMKHGLLDE